MQSSIAEINNIHEIHSHDDIPMLSLFGSGKITHTQVKDQTLHVLSDVLYDEPYHTLTYVPDNNELMGIKETFIKRIYMVAVTVFFLKLIGTSIIVFIFGMQPLQYSMLFIGSGVCFILEFTLIQLFTRNERQWKTPDSLRWQVPLFCLMSVVSTYNSLVIVSYVTLIKMNLVIITWYLTLLYFCSTFGILNTSSKTYYLVSIFLSTTELILIDYLLSASTHKWQFFLQIILDNVVAYITVLTTTFSVLSIDSKSNFREVFSIYQKCISNFPHPNNIAIIFAENLPKRLNRKGIFNLLRLT